MSCTTQFDAIPQPLLAEKGMDEAWAALATGGEEVYAVLPGSEICALSVLPGGPARVWCRAVGGAPLWSAAVQGSQACDISGRRNTVLVSTTTPGEGEQEGHLAWLGPRGQLMAERLLPASGCSATTVAADGMSAAAYGGVLEIYDERYRQISGHGIPVSHAQLASTRFGVVWAGAATSGRGSGLAVGLVSPRSGPVWQLEVGSGPTYAKAVAALPDGRIYVLVFLRDQRVPGFGTLALAGFTNEGASLGTQVLWETGDLVHARFFEYPAPHFVLSHTSPPPGRGDCGGADVVTTVLALDGDVLP